jgi:hypothetical protein
MSKAVARYMLRNRPRKPSAVGIYWNDTTAVEGAAVKEGFVLSCEG